MKKIPNLLVWSRFLMAVGVLLAAATDQWKVGFVLIALGLLSDIADGWLAQKLDASSNWGATCDPIADTVLTGLAGLGLLLTGHLALWLALALVSVTVVYMIVIQWLPKPMPQRYIVDGLHALYFMAVAVWFMLEYAGLAGYPKGSVLFSALFLGVILGIYRHDRIREWFPLARINH